MIRGWAVWEQGGGIWNVDGGILENGWNSLMGDAHGALLGDGLLAIDGQFHYGMGPYCLRFRQML